MEKRIEGTNKTPEFNFNFSRGELSLRGISIPENPGLFYAEIYASIDDYLKNPAKNTVINFDLEYFNSSSAIAIRDVIRKFEEHNVANNCVVKWYHDEDDQGIESSGHEFKSIFPGLNFEIIGLDRSE
ncbi:MAG: DUF1987 domain-containing protein [Flavobacteriales bacterium]|nr:DUF1987 domain-containing protein [Flavobacteriales bacterium]